MPDLVLHAFTDGRDTLPKSGAGYVEEAQRWLRHAGRIGTVGGRYWGMDRDSRWDRTKRAYDAIVHARARARMTPCRRSGRPTSGTRPTSSSSPP